MEKNIETWLSEYSTPNTRRALKNRIAKFLEWSKLSPEELRGLEPEEITHKLHVFQNKMIEAEHSKNSVRNYVGAVKQYLAFCGTALPRLKTVKANRRPIVKFHYFSNGDLANMLDIANTEEKALISTLASCGWSIDDVLSMQREFIISLIGRAKAEGEDFVFYEDTRRKSGAIALCVLNPLAIKWITKWNELNKNKKLFPLSYEGYYYRLSQTFKKAIRNPVGKFRIHNIRKWTINSLIKAGFGQSEWKYTVGKAIGASDETYLDLTPIIKEKYPRQYNKYLAIKPSVVNENQFQTQNKELKKLQQTNRILQTDLMMTKAILDKIVSGASGFAVELSTEEWKWVKTGRVAGVSGYGGEE